MNKESCPCCQSNKIRKDFNLVDHEYAVSYRSIYTLCDQCQSLYQNPMPKFEQLAAFYPENYHSFLKKTVINDIRNQLRFNRLCSLINSEKVRILDYGCGNGNFILTAAQKNSQAQFFGYEISSKNEIQVFYSGRVTIIKGDLDYLFEQVPVCDIISMNHVIEHLPNVSEVLEVLVKKLKSGGVLEGQTPAADSLERLVFKTKWSGFHAPRHTIIFSRNSLMKILSQNNFEKIYITAAFNPAAIAVSLGSLFHGDAPGRIVREGYRWLFLLVCATLLAPIDLLSGYPGIINFSAIKK